MTSTASAANLTAVKWIDAATGRVAAFASQSGNWGVVDAEGRMFSTKGERPSVWGTKAIADQIAEAGAFLAGGFWMEQV